MIGNKDLWLIVCKLIMDKDDRIKVYYLFEKLLGLRGNIDTIIEEFKQRLDAIEISPEIIENIKQDFINKLEAFLAELSEEGNNSINQRIEEIINTINNNLDAKIEVINNNFAQYKLTLEGDLSDYKNNINEIINQFKTSINGQFNNYKTELNTELNNYKTTFENKLNEINNKTTEINTKITENKNLLDAEIVNLRKIIEDFKTEINDYVIQIKNKIYADFADLDNIVKTKVDAYIATLNLGGGSEGGSGITPEQLTTAIDDKFTEWISNPNNQLNTFITQQQQRITDYLTSKDEEFNTWFSNKNTEYNTWISRKNTEINNIKSEYNELITSLQAKLNELTQLINDTNNAKNAANEAVSNINEKITNINAIITEVNKLITDGNKVITDGNKVINDINTYITNINDSINNANTATNNANDAVERVNAKLEELNNQGGNPDLLPDINLIETTIVTDIVSYRGDSNEKIMITADNTIKIVVEKINYDGDHLDTYVYYKYYLDHSILEVGYKYIIKIYTNPVYKDLTFVSLYGFNVQQLYIGEGFETINCGIYSESVKEIYLPSTLKAFNISSEKDTLSTQYGGCYFPCVKCNKIVFNSKTLPKLNSQFIFGSFEVINNTKICIGMNANDRMAYFKNTITLDDFTEQGWDRLIEGLSAQSATYGKFTFNNTL